MNNGKIVIIEGTTCTGKTTLCENLEKQGWIVLKNSNKYVKSSLPKTLSEEEFYQDELFRIEKQKIIKANELKKAGKNVALDTSAVSIVANAKLIEKHKKIDEIFTRAFLQYIDFVNQMNNEGLIECDTFLLLTSDYNTISKRNVVQSHKLQGIDIDEKIIAEQKNMLEKMTKSVVGKIGGKKIEKETIDTTNLSKEQVVYKFNDIVNEKQKDGMEI